MQRHDLAFVDRLRESGVPVQRLADMGRVPAPGAAPRRETSRLAKIQAGTLERKVPVRPVPGSAANS